MVFSSSLAVQLKRKAKCVDLPAAICNALKTLKDPTTKDKKREQAQEDVEKSMALLREGLYGLSGTELVEAADVAEVRAAAAAVCVTRFLSLMLRGPGACVCGLYRSGVGQPRGVPL